MAGTRSSLSLSAILVCLLATAFGRATIEDGSTSQNPEYGEDWEGDILLTQEQTELDLNNVSPLNAIWDKSKKWKGSTIYYEVHEDYDDELMHLLSMAIIDLVESVKVDNQFCIKILPRQREKNYVFIKDGGCSSHVGMIGGGQRLKLSPSCLRRHGTVMHEFIHALGFHHEQKRSDRDEHVTINWDNIKQNHLKNFNKLVLNSTVDLLGTPYDYGSIMHYSRTAFAIDYDVDTISPHDPDAEIGQRTKLSDVDKERIQILYNCIKPEDSKYFKHLIGKKYLRRSH